MRFKYNEVSDFYKLLGEFKMHNVISTEEKQRKKWVINNVVKLYRNFFDSYEETYDEEDLNEKEARYSKQFKITGVGDNKLSE